MSFLFPMSPDAEGADDVDAISRHPAEARNDGLHHGYNDP